MKHLKTYENNKKYKPILKGDYVKIKPSIGKTEKSAARLLGDFQYYRDAIFIARENGDEPHIQLDWYNYYDEDDLQTGYAGYIPTNCLQVLTPEELENYNIIIQTKKYNI